jgi:hypothetical protein
MNVDVVTREVMMRTRGANKGPFITNLLALAKSPQGLGIVPFWASWPWYDRHQHDRSLSTGSIQIFINRSNNVILDALSTHTIQSPPTNI